MDNFPVKKNNTNHEKLHNYQADWFQARTVRKAGSGQAA